jgi:hypothetical protein
VDVPGNAKALYRTMPRPPRLTDLEQAAVDMLDRGTRGRASFVTGDKA